MSGFVAQRGKAPSKLIVIGLTGGIASGKSTAAHYLAKRGGATVIDADQLGHQAYRSHRPAFAKVVAAFGKDIVGADGEIERKALGDKVFGDPEQLTRLTDIVWPEILTMARAEIAAAATANAALVVLEAAVLLEANWQDAVDEVWVVTIEPNIAVQRATTRDGANAAAVQARVNAQLSDAERTARADVAIDNTGTQADLFGQLDLELLRLGSLA